MKRKSWNKLYDIQQDLIRLYLNDSNKKTRREIDRIIKSLTRILEKQFK